MTQEQYPKKNKVTGEASANLDLGPSPELGLDLKHFLQEPAAMQEKGKERNLSQGPPAEDCKN